MKAARKQRDVVEAIEKAGEWVAYDYQLDLSDKWMAVRHHQDHRD